MAINVNIYQILWNVFHTIKPLTVRVSIYQGLLNYNTWDNKLVGWLRDKKFHDIAILEDGELKQFSERSPDLWNNNKMNNPFKKVADGNEFNSTGITFKH